MDDIKRLEGEADRVKSMNSQVPSLIAILSQMREDGALFILRNPDIVELRTPPETH